MSVYEKLIEALRRRSRSVLAYVDGKPVYLLEAAADAIEALTASQAEPAAAEPVEHRATVIAYTAHGTDEHLTLAIECGECPRVAGQPMRWGHLTDTRDNHAFLLAEAERHNENRELVA